MTITASVEAAEISWRPLGELFVSRGLISEAELETALAEQTATGKRLGEILVDRGLVSGPDLTSALMDQLGIEISKEEGFGSGLWAEIKRRHKRVRPDLPEGEEPDVSERSEIALVPPSGGEPAVPEPDVSEPEPEPIALPEPEPIVLPPAAVDRELHQEFEEYQPPAPIEAPAPPPAAECQCQCQCLRPQPRWRPSPSRGPSRRTPRPFAPSSKRHAPTSCISRRCWRMR